MSGRAEVRVGGPAKASETPQGMKSEDSLGWSGLGGHAGRPSGNDIVLTLGVGGQRELLNSEMLRESKGALTLGQRMVSW